MGNVLLGVVPHLPKRPTPSPDCLRPPIHPQIHDAYSKSPPLQVQTSCGFAVPFLALRPDPADPSKFEPYLHDRDTLGHWAGKQISAGRLRAYQRDNNYSSLDGLPGLRVARKDKGERLWYGDVKMKLKQRNGVCYTTFVALVSALFTMLCMQMLGLTTVRLPLVVR